MEVTQSKEPTQGAKADQKPEIDPAIIDELMKGYRRPEDMTGPGGIPGAANQTGLRADSWGRDDPLPWLRERASPAQGRGPEAQKSPQRDQ